MEEMMFEFFDPEKTKLTVKTGRSEGASTVETKCASECEKLLDDFAESDKDKSGVWYHCPGENMSSIAAALEKFAEEKGLHISAVVAETADGEEAILLTKLGETEFKEVHEKLKR